ncbi:MAG TPA: ATP-binding protein [Kofleriaceae bacterium]|nr:ATP-binding protein [Kofleriaceae bacterium]
MADDRHFAATQRIAHCGSWELDGPAMRWSDETFRILGHDPKHFAPTIDAFVEAAAIDDRQTVRAALEGRRPFSIDHHIVRPDGSVRVIHTDGDGELGTILDVTEARSTEAQLVFADRLASVGALAAGVAHEINNPLAAAVANLDLIERALDGGRSLADLRDRVRDASEGVARVTAIVRDLMTFSRADDARRAVDIPQVLESALRLLSHDVKHRARVERSYAAVPIVFANEARLGQVFLNLLRNAVEAIPDDDPELHAIRLSIVSHAGRVVVAIADTGIGIPAELQPQVFAPFFTTKRVGRGSGLGLAICQRIVTELGGELTFKSEVGRGSEFRVALPARVPAIELVGWTPRPAPPRRYRILVVDDEPMITSALQRILADHEIVVLHSARPAIDAIAAGARYDAILCDLMMPQMNGLDLHEEIARIAPDQAARTIVMTGGTFSVDVRTRLSESGVVQIDKPFDVDRLRELVARAAH